MGVPALPQRGASNLRSAPGTIEKFLGFAEDSYGLGGGLELMHDESTPVSLGALLADVAWARRLAAALVGEHDGDDLVQRVLTRALRRDQGVREEPPVEGGKRGYWRRALGYEASNLRRSRARRLAREQAKASESAEVPDPAEVAAQLEQRKRLAEQLLALPEDQRYLLILRYDKGLDSAEIGRRLGHSASTVRSSLARARDHLAKKLKQQDPDWQRGMALLVGTSARNAAGGAAAAQILGVGMSAKAWATVAGLGLLALGSWRLLQPAHHEGAIQVATLDRQNAEESLSLIHI